MRIKFNTKTLIFTLLLSLIVSTLEVTPANQHMTEQANKAGTHLKMMQMIEKDQVVRKPTNKPASVSTARIRGALPSMKEDSVSANITMKDPTRKQECANPATFQVVLPAKETRI